MNTEKAPFRLALLRHADAEWPMPGERDFDRRLSIFSKQQARDCAYFLQTIDFHPSAAITSPALRCAETLAIINELWMTGLTPHQDSGLYNSSIDEYLNTISEYVEHKDLLLAGHNPTLEELLVKMVGNDQAMTAMPDGFPTGAVAIIDFVRPLNIFAARGKLVGHFVPAHRR